MPDGIEDRNADVWEALLAVADLAGGDWPERARVAAVALVTASSDAHGEPRRAAAPRPPRRLRATPSGCRPRRSSTRLHELDESPWGDLRGKPLDARGLARRLGKYGVKPKVIRVGAGQYRSGGGHLPSR